MVEIKCAQLKTISKGVNLANMDKPRLDMSFSGVKKLELGLTILAELPPNAHSRVRSHYCPTRRLLPAGFLPWADSSRLRQPGDAGLLPHHHIDAGLSMDTRSTWRTR